MTDRFRRSAASALLSVCVLGGTPHARAAQPATRPASATGFSADVVVERTTVDRSGAVVTRMPKVRYRVTEHRGPSGATTEIAFQNTPPFPGRGPLQDPSAGFKVLVNDRDGITVVDPSGKVVPADNPRQTGPGATTTAPTDAPASAPRASRPDGTSGLGLERSGAARREALVARFGSPVGRYGNHDRFVRNEADTFEEVLVDPDTALPVEINTLRAGRLVNRSSLSYATLPDGRFYCSSQRDEALVDPDDEAGPRNVTTTTYTVVTGGVR
jgi:hypothetical protein